jgi:hypothetical protein
MSKQTMNAVAIEMRGARPVGQPFPSSAGPQFRLRRDNDVLFDSGAAIPYSGQYANSVTLHRSVVRYDLAGASEVAIHARASA